VTTPSDQSPTPLHQPSGEVPADGRSGWRPETRAIRAGRPVGTRALAPTLWASTAWTSADAADARRRAQSLRAPDFYSRYANPTVSAFEHAVADLEGAEAALAFASGMGALSATVLALCRTGSHVVAQRQMYAGTIVFLEAVCPRLGIEVSFVDATVPGSFVAAVQPGRTVLVMAETPSNPRLELADLEELGSIRGPFTVVDSTFATPLGQRPLTHGVSLSMHSATKGIGGHNDATLGVIAGERDLVDAIWSYAVLHGACASPFDALNALRGMRTLPVRFARQCQTAGVLAEELRHEPGIAAVLYPGLDSHPQHALARAQMDAFGTVLAVEVAGGLAAAQRFVESVRLAQLATSLGGPETLVCHPPSTTHAALPPEDREAQGITDGLVRISVGLEHESDLLADLRAALACAAG
jgi:cystathionine beta-lyase/cystathionine gamma-synthase